MDIREKLIEILREPIFPHEMVDPIEAVADYLLDSGVTVREWIPASEPPKERGIYQVFMWDKEMERSKVWYGQFTGCDWSVYDIYGDGMRCEVTHWMPLPQPPKE